jgi:hydroxypyruvate reductase
MIRAAVEVFVFRTEPDEGVPAARETALACVRAGIRAADPERVVGRAVDLEGDRLTVGEERRDLSDHDRIVVLGGGKAAAGVARALDRNLGDRLSGGLVVAPEPADAGRVEVAVGDHPVPSERGVDATRRLLELAREADERTLVLAVVTGGGSALLAAPAEGVSLADLRTTTRRLLDAGASVDEINAVRKHLSTVKGGGLVSAAAPASVLGLVLSDVVGDDLSVVASGPTAPDDSTYADALAVLTEYGVDAPTAVRGRLERGCDGEFRETLRADDPRFERVRNVVLASGYTAADAARTVATDRGYDTLLLSSRVRGEAREAAKTHAAVAEEIAATGDPVTAPAVVVSSGETTVSVRGDGTGGPNLEFALSAAVEFAEGPLAGRGSPVADGSAAGDSESEPGPEPAVALASVDTDGRDGSTDAAGALVAGDTVDDPATARDALARNDALPYLRSRDALVVTGPTGTNVNDLRVLVVGDDDAGASHGVDPDDRSA